MNGDDAMRARPMRPFLGSSGPLTQNQKDAIRDAVLNGGTAYIMNGVVVTLPGEGGASGSVRALFLCLVPEVAMERAQAVCAVAQGRTHESKVVGGDGKEAMLDAVRAAVAVAQAATNGDVAVRSRPRTSRARCVRCVRCVRCG